MKNEDCITRIVFLVLFIALVVLCCIQFGFIGKGIVISDVTKENFSNYLTMFNEWIGFWLSILTLILMLAGIWQYLQIRRYDSEFKDIKQEVKEKQDKYDEKLKEIERNYRKGREKIKIETSLSIMLRAIGSINDPLMLLDSSERKQLLYHYLSECRTLINQYSRCMDSDCDNKHEIAMDFQYVLLNVRICLCRMQTLFPDPMIGIHIKNFMEEAKKKDEDIRTSDYASLADFEWLAKEIGKALSKTYN